jgi:hypothetical protein
LAQFEALSRSQIQCHIQKCHTISETWWNGRRIKNRISSVFRRFLYNLDENSTRTVVYRNNDGKIHFQLARSRVDSTYIRHEIFLNSDDPWMTNFKMTCEPPISVQISLRNQRSAMRLFMRHYQDTFPNSDVPCELYTHLQRSRGILAENVAHIKNLPFALLCES